MDQVKIGKYIALLRRQAGLTQEQLGEKLGVTNKTVSRWENGNYMPDIEMFGLIAKEFNVSINDLLAGERIPDEDFRQRADENIIAVATSSVFSIDDRRTYLKRKWRKEHIFLFVIMGIILLAQHILPKFGEMELDDLTPLVLQRFISELMEHGNLRTGDGLSANTVNAIITVIQSALKVANNLAYIGTYTADKIKRPKANEKQVECFTTSEQKRIEQAVLMDKRPKMFGIILCLYTGLRIGELLALEWTDIDFSKGELTVSKTCHDAKTENGYCRVTDVPKTQTSRRVIPIPRQILPLLREQKKKSKSTFVVGEDRVQSVRSYQYSFSLLLKKLSIPHHGFHALRHTFATRALECGMDVKTLSEILGHKNSVVTLNRYAHSLMPHKHDAMNRLGKLF